MRTDHEGRVLVVDDDPDVRDALAVALEAEGYAVRAAGHGREALNLLLGDGWAPELIILDLLMPIMDGRDFRGMQLADELVRGGGRPIPVIVLSAMPDLQGAAGPLEPVAILAKPFELDELFQHARGALNGRP